MTEHGYEPPSHPGPLESWPETEYDAVLHLLDRQVVDLSGRMVGKVDDVELTVGADGSLVPTALLLGPAALLPRFGGTLGCWLADRHRQMRPAEADRGEPYVIELALVDGVSSEVHLSVDREGLMRRRGPEPGGPVRHRLGELLQMTVRLPEGAPGPAKAGVLDVCFGPVEHGTQRMTGLVVGHGRPGSTLGYDRRAEQGPWLIAAVVRRLHRHSCVVELGPDVDIVWATGEVRVGAAATIRPLPE